MQDRLCKLLNELLKADPESTAKFYNMRAKFDIEKIKDVDILVHGSDEIGILGLINSAIDCPKIAAAVNNETGLIDEFVLVNKEDLEK